LEWWSHRRWEWTEHIARMEEKRNALWVFVAETDGTKPLGRLRRILRIILSRVWVTIDYRRGFELDNWIYWHLIHTIRDCKQLQRYRYSTHFQFTVTHALGFSVFTSRNLATDL
jgi:hypothetical protein